MRYDCRLIKYRNEDINNESGDIFCIKIDLQYFT